MASSGPEEHYGRRAHHHQDQQQYQDGRQQHHQQRLAGRRRVHLPDAHRGQVEPVQGGDPPDERYPSHESRHRGVGDYAEGRPEPRVPPSNHHHHQKVRHQGGQEDAHGPRYGGDHQPPQERQEPLVPARAEQRGEAPGNAQEGEQPDQQHGDLDAYQGENKRSEQAPLPRETREEGLGLEHHAPYDVREAADRVGEVVVPARGSSRCHLLTLRFRWTTEADAPQLYPRTQKGATVGSPFPYSPECVEG